MFSLREHQGGAFLAPSPKRREKAHPQKPRYVHIGGSSHGDVVSSWAFFEKVVSKALSTKVERALETRFSPFLKKPTHSICGYMWLYVYLCIGVYVCIYIYIHISI
jgi:hypothetical protein